jgi:hypothetical protein
MFPYVKRISLAISLTFLLSCNEGRKILSYSVADITTMDTREIEEMGSFYVRGKVDGKINVGFIKALILRDNHQSHKVIYIISNHKSLPTTGKECVLKVDLYKEISIFEGEFLLFEEF